MNSWELFLIPFPTLPGDRRILETLKEELPGLVYPCIAVLLPPSHPDLAEETLRNLHLRIEEYYQSWLYGFIPSEFSQILTKFWTQARSSKLRVLSLFLGNDELPARKELLIELVWSLKLRRLQWLEDHPEALKGLHLNRLDLYHLDELYEMEAHYSRGRILRGESDGTALLFLVFHPSV